MQLFLDYREAFEEAWGLYLLHNGDTRLASYPVQLPTLQTDADTLAKLEVDLGRHYATQGRGRESILRCCADGTEITLYIQRGEKMRALPYWKAGSIDVAAIRRAGEDFVAYNAVSGALTIKSSHRRDQDVLLSAFTYHMAGDGSLARQALESPMFTLLPFQRGTFDYGGNQDVHRVVVTGIKIRLKNPNATTHWVTSRDLLADQQRPGYQGPYLDQGELLSIRLKFWIRTGRGKPRGVSYTIVPPNHSLLTQERYGEIIARYLKEQGVMHQ